MSRNSIVQERVMPPTPRTIILDAEAQINCLAVTKNFNMVAVAGRTVFKIFTLDEDAINEKCNFRSVQKTNLNYSASDVAWSPHDENILASASTNGSIVFWDLNKLSKNKQEDVLNQHGRAVNRLCYHDTEHVLLSCANDGACKLYDVRKKEPVANFPCQISLHDVKWWPSQYFCFASAAENGIIQIWDYRQANSSLSDFPAHNGPVFALDFHPEEKNLLASGGRDKLIKVWKLADPSQNCGAPKHAEQQIQAISGVGRVKWRPKRSHQIASVAMGLDFGVNIWDLRRPFIPVATFNEHKDVVTSVLWKDSHVFISGGKDSKLILHAFRDAVRIAEKANPVALAICGSGQLSLAVNEKLLSPAIRNVPSPVAGAVSTAMATAGTKLGLMFAKPADVKQDKQEQFLSETLSLFFVFSKEDLLFCRQDFNMEWFISCAKKYVLYGKSLDELCQHNSEVAEGNVQISKQWTLLKTFCSSINNTPYWHGRNPPLTHKIDQVPRPTEGIAYLTNGHSDKAYCDQEPLENGEVTSGEGDSDSGVPNTSTNPIITPDFFFQDDQIDNFEFYLEEDPVQAPDKEWNLPSEGFVQSHDLNDPADPTAHDYPNRHHPYNGMRFPSEQQSELKLPEKVSVSVVEPGPSLDLSHIVVDTLKAYAEMGDVQTAVCMWIVAGQKLKLQLDEATLERWCTSYIELLERFKLWSEAAIVIKRCNIKSISSLNQQSTSIHTVCSKCLKPILDPAGWYCVKCQKVTTLCAVCHLPVKGLYVWCQGCTHGGHLGHMRHWFSNNKLCPSGCGHMCEFS